MIKKLLQNWLLKGDVGRWDERMLTMIGFNKNNDVMSKPYSQYNVVYTAIKKIGNACFQIPLCFYENDVKVSSGAPISKLFSRYPHLVEGMVTFLNLHGEAFVYMAPSVGQLAGTYNLPASLELVSPKMMKHKVNKDTGEITHWVFNDKIKIPNEQLMHVKFYNPYDPYRGLSPIDSVRITMDADFAAQKYNQSFFENSAMPESILTMDKEAEVNDKVLSKLKNELLSKHQGSDKQHLPLILQGGMEWKTLNVTQKEMDFLKSKKFNRDDVLSVFGVHPFVAGYTDEGDTNRSTADTAYYLFYTNTIVPTLSRISITVETDMCNRLNLPYTAKFDTSKIVVLKRDYTQRVKDAKNLLVSGFGRDEVNEKLDLGFDDVGDNTRFVTGSLKTVDQVIADSKNTDKDEDKDGDDTKSVRELAMLEREVFNLLSRAMKKFLFDQRKQVLNQLPKDLESTKEKDYMESYNKIVKVLEKTNKLNKILKPIYEDTYEKAECIRLEAANSKEKVVLDGGVISDKVSRLSDIINPTSKIRKELYDAFDKGETVSQIADRIKTVYNGIDLNGIIRTKTVGKL